MHHEIVSGQDVGPRLDEDRQTAKQRHARRD
jgi:hypothetical protein